MKIAKEGVQDLFELVLHCHNHTRCVGLFVLVIVVEAG